MWAKTAGNPGPGIPCCQTYPGSCRLLEPCSRVPFNIACVCYAGLGPGMHPRTFVFITLLALCHLQLGGQVLTNALRAPSYETPVPDVAAKNDPATQLPDDPNEEILPVAQPQPAPSNSVPVRWEAGRQTRVGDTWTLSGGVVVHYRDYILRADRVVYHQSTTELGSRRTPPGSGWTR